MTYQALLAFLLPDFEIIQIIFIGIILSLITVTIIMVLIQANEHHWEKNGKMARQMIIRMI